ncbi:MAG: hypothetical protein FWD69_19815 [Polyangiaceae bacterium]|nr:hypothetical protein [Polyangiaceae bacterium]
MSTTNQNTTTMTVSQAESYYGNPKPQIKLHFPKGTNYHDVLAALDKLADDIESAIPAKERWIVTKDFDQDYGRVYLELGNVPPVEAERAMAFLHTVVG